MRALGVAALAALGLSLALPGEARAQYASQIPLWVDLRDVVAFAGGGSRDFQAVRAVLADMARHPRRYFPRDVGYRFLGASRPGRTRHNAVYGIELEADPVRLGPEQSEYRIIALMHARRVPRRYRFFFRRYRIQVDHLRGGVLSVDVTENIPLSETKFTITAGLIERKAVLVDVEHGIRKVYPIGVGGFDEGVSDESRGRTRLLTPRFRNAALRRSASVFARKEPWYFRSKPFIRLVNAEGRWTPIAFHAKQNADFVRGFDSHGCMRLRDKDLYELFYIVRHHGGGRNRRLIVDVAHRIDFDADHPYPRTDTGYQRVKNFGTKEAPRSARRCPRTSRGGRRPSNCRNDLTVMEKTAGRPPVRDLEQLHDEPVTVPDPPVLF